MKISILQWFNFKDLLIGDMRISKLNEAKRRRKLGNMARKIQFDGISATVLSKIQVTEQEKISKDLQRKDVLRQALRPSRESNVELNQ